MSWSTEQKIIEQSPNGEILTPDGQQILVGEFENEVLIYLLGFDNWNLPEQRNFPPDWQTALEEGFTGWIEVDTSGTITWTLIGSIVRLQDENYAFVQRNDEILLLWWTFQDWKLKTKIVS